MELNCTNCGEFIPADNFNLDTMIAYCPNCGEHVDFSEVFKAPTLPRRKLDAPKTFLVEQLENGKVIRFSWFSWRAPVFLAAGIALIGIPVMMLNVVGGEGARVSGVLLIMFALVSLFGIGLTYYSMAEFINHTEIRLNSGSVQVHHGPIPMPGNFSMRSDLIQRVQRQEVIHQNEYGTTNTYNVQLLTTDNEYKIIVKGLKTINQAGYIVQEANAYIETQRQQSNRGTATA